MTMSIAQEFHYRLPRRVSGFRPGSHPGSSLGAGQEFVSHMSLYDRPDPRRLDLRASLRNLGGDCLVRVNRQRAGIPVYLLVDVSASMSFGALKPKLHVVADFAEALGHSAFRVGDALGMVAFDAGFRDDLHVPAMVGRGMSSFIAPLLRQCATRAGTEGVEEAAVRLANRARLVFLASDFHWPLERLAATLDLLAHAYVVPMIVWDPAETTPPARDAIGALCDAESGKRRTLWIRPRLRDAWRDAVAARRAELERFFAARTIRPFYMNGAFDADALSQYFFEAAA